LLDPELSGETLFQNSTIYEDVEKLDGRQSVSLELAELGVSCRREELIKLRKRTRASLRGNIKQRGEVEDDYF